MNHRPHPAPLSLATALALTLALALATGCPSAPPRPEAPSAVAPPEAPRAPEVVPFDPAARRFLFSDADLADPATSRQARRERRLWHALVLPLKTAVRGDEADIMRGLGLADVLVRALTLHGADLDPPGAGPILDPVYQRGIASFFETPHLFPAGSSASAWLDDPGPALPPELAEADLRWLVGGNLLAAHGGGPRRVFLWLMDRVDGKVWSGTCELDLPRVQRPRLLLLKLLTDAGLSPTETERGDWLWTEDLSDAALVALGRSAVAQAWTDPERIRPAVTAVIAAAPWSYTARLAEADGILRMSGGCAKAVTQAFDRALAVNPHVDFLNVLTDLGCAVTDLDADADTGLFDALQRSGATNCGVAGKAIASIGGGREVPGSGFLAGLGGIYRGSSCRDGGGRDQERLAGLAKDPFVAAGLLVDAAVGAIAGDDRGRAERLLGEARTALASLPEPRGCVVRLSEAEIALHEAGLHFDAGDREGAKRLAAEASAIGAACLDPRVEARVMNLVGLVEQSIGRYDKALAAFGQALRGFEAVGDEMNAAVAHTNLGWTRSLLGQPKAALPDLELALAGKRRVRSDGGVAVALENLGVTLMTLGRYADAEPLLVEARELVRDPTVEADILNALARIRAGQGRHAEASALLAEALELARSARSRVVEAQIEQSTGGLAAERGELMAALDAFNQALVIRREVGDRAGEGLTLASLMNVMARLHRRPLAIVYGKLAIAAHEEVKRAATALGPEAERDFVATRAKTYRQLAALLVGEGRLVEAERVLALMKVAEADDWTRSASTTKGPGVPLTKHEKDLEQRYRASADKVMAIGHDYGALAAKAPLSAADQARLDGLRKQLQAANANFGKFLATLAERNVPERGIESLRDGAGIGPDLAELPGTVVVYTLVTDEAVIALVVSADTQAAETTVVAPGALAQLVADFRAALQDPRSDPRVAGKELYDVLVAPVAKHLEGAQAKTVLWSLDRVLRYVPVGALWDGERYVVERWPSAVFTPASPARLKDKPLSHWRVLAAGVTRAAEGFPALPAVRGELDGIVDDAATPEVDGVLPGVEVLDDAFDEGAFVGRLAERWPVVHVASHFAFEPGDQEASFLVLGKGRLTVSALAAVPNLFTGVDLLALSACNTAVGDAEGQAGREVESFAVLAQRKGARAVLASLWPVADRSTGRLMQRFYELHAVAGTTKLDALRGAQLEMLRGKLAPAPGGDGAPADWTHPYYWAPFVLIGNTL